MYSNIMEMDRQLGELMRQLEEDGLLDKTIIVFYSDNGGPLPRGKREVYESGIHVPLIIRFPHKKDAGTINNDLVSFVDFAPTMLSLAGLPIPAYMQGRAFLGSQKSVVPRKYVFAARDRMDSEYDMVRAVRDKRYEYIRNFHPELPYIQDIEYRKQMDLMQELLRFEKEGKLNAVQQLWFRKTKPAEELYDVKSDPFELHDLAGDSAYSEKRKELRAQLDRWMEYCGDKGFISEKELLESMWPGMKQPVTEKPLFLDDGAVSIRCSTPGSSISWQILDSGQTVNEQHWQLYQHPLIVPAGKVLLAFSERIGYKASRVEKFVPARKEPASK
jgi:arylsulfatase A-like enzyme